MVVIPFLDSNLLDSSYFPHLVCEQTLHIDGRLRPVTHMGRISPKYPPRMFKVVDISLVAEF